MGQEESADNSTETAVGLDNVNLQNRNISKIPREILETSFAQIVCLNLSQNRIKCLPLGLPNLHSLIISSNNLTCINRQMTTAILTYANLDMLDLSLNYITEIPYAITNIRTLKRIITFGNHLSFLDCYISSAITLDCGQNWFEVPPKCSPVTQYLNLDMNFLKTVDMPIKNLIRACFKMNQISSISDKVCFHMLQVLDLAHNQLKELPDLSIITPKLKFLDASFNHIIKFPNLPKAILEVDLEKNYIQDIPENLSKYSTMAQINLANNEIIKFPSFPQNVHTLNLENNNITYISSSNASELIHFNITKNKITEIPVLQNCKLSDCRFSFNKIVQINFRSISKKVTKLDLSCNLIEELPSELFDPNEFPHLLHLYLARNKIKTLPSSFQKSTIISFNISSNPISHLPSILPKTIEFISCANCGLNELPASLSDLEELVELDASGNNLTEIPFMEDLTLLHLSMNNLSEFPKISFKLVSLDLSLNKISTIPENMKFHNLHYVDLSYNNLESFPISFIAPKLYSLKLSHNPQLAFQFDTAAYKCLNHLDIVETKIAMPNNTVPSSYIVETSDGSLFAAPNTRLVHCDSWCAISQKKGLRESIEDAFVIRTSLQQDLNLFGIWDSLSGGKTAAIGAYELTNYISNRPFEFTEEYICKYCDTMSHILDERSFIDGSSMGLCVTTKAQLLSANCGDISIIIIDEEGKADVLENTSILPNEQYFERAEHVSMKSFMLYLGLNQTSHFVIGIRDLKPTDKWIAIATVGVTDVISPSEIGEISLNVANSTDFSYRIISMVRASMSTDSASFIAYNIKEASVQ